MAWMIERREKHKRWLRNAKLDSKLYQQRIVDWFAALRIQRCAAVGSVLTSKRFLQSSILKESWYQPFERSPYRIHIGT
eukprot:1120736-Prorocentrum_minimum.AAC.1